MALYLASLQISFEYENNNTMQITEAFKDTFMNIDVHCKNSLK